MDTRIKALRVVQIHQYKASENRFFSLGSVSYDLVAHHIGNNCI